MGSTHAHEPPSLLLCEPWSPFLSSIPAPPHQHQRLCWSERIAPSTFLIIRILDASGLARLVTLSVYPQSLLPSRLPPSLLPRRFFSDSGVFLSRS